MDIKQYYTENPLEFFKAELRLELNNYEENLVNNVLSGFDISIRHASNVKLDEILASLVLFHCLVEEQAVLHVSHPTLGVQPHILRTYVKLADQMVQFELPPDYSENPQLPNNTRIPNLSFEASESNKNGFKRAYFGHVGSSVNNLLGFNEIFGGDISEQTILYTTAVPKNPASIGGNLEAFEAFMEVWEKGATKIYPWSIEIGVDKEWRSKQINLVGKKRFMRHFDKLEY